MDALAIIQWALETEDTAVDLGGLGLTNLPTEIDQLTAVEHLSLRDNHLTQLPTTIGNLTNLRQLSIADNHLTHLPPAIGRLTNLTHLNLRNNQLTQLPAEITSLTSLKMLQLSGNPLPLPDYILGKWNQPEAIIRYYRDNFLAQETAAPTDRNTLFWILTNLLTAEAFADLCADLTLPPGTISGETRPEQAQALLDFHEAHGLADEFADLLHILQRTHRVSYDTLREKRSEP